MAGVNSSLDVDARRSQTAHTRFIRREVAIVAAVRTAIGKGGKGTLKDVRPDTMLARVITAAVDKAKLKPTDVEDVVVGCAMPEAEQGMNVARISALLAGIPETASAMTLNRFCS